MHTHRQRRETRTLIPPIVRADNLRGVWAWRGPVRARWRDVGRAGGLSADEVAGSANGAWLGPRPTHGQPRVRAEQGHSPWPFA